MADFPVVSKLKGKKLVLGQMIKEAHQEELLKNQHVTLLFEDGEVVNTKADGLLFQRTLHVRLDGVGRQMVGIAELTGREGKDWIAVSDEDAAIIWQEMIKLRIEMDLKRSGLLRS